MLSILSFVSSSVLTYIVMPMFYDMLLNNNCTELNYNKEQIPIGMGLVFVFIQTFTIYIVSFYMESMDVFILAYIISILSIGIVGLLDDIIGEKKIKGFKGHLSSLLKRKLTTGGLKLIVGGISGVLISILISTGLVQIIINTAIIGLFTNLINIFDLRPGRAGKVFVLLSLILLFTSRAGGYNYIIISLLGIILVYLPKDLKAKVMMGDVGSNILGITLGIFCTITQVLEARILYLTFLIMIHIISEFYSFTDIIDNNKVLCYIDKLGRK